MNIQNIAEIQTESICENIKTMIDFIKFNFGWRYFEIVDMGFYEAKFFVGTVIKEKENVEVYENGLSYTARLKEVWEDPVAGTLDSVPIH